MTMLPPDPIYIFKGEMEPILCIAFKITPCIEQLYAGTQVGMVHVWNLKTNREVGKFKTGEDSCLSVITCTDDDKLVITHDKTGHIMFWEESNYNWTLKKEIEIDFFGFCKVSVFQDVLFAPLKNAKCQMISIKSSESVNIINLNDSSNLGEIMSFKNFILKNQKIILVAYEGYKLAIWDVDSVQKVSEFSVDGCPMAIDYDVNTNKGICGNPTEKILIFTINSDLEFKAVRTIQLLNPGVASVQIRPDSKLVAVGCWDGKLRLYSWKTLVLLAVLDTHSSTVQDVVFTKWCTDVRKDKYLLAAGSKDCKVSLWDLYN